eukprot:1152012-Pelagomonas_calceolata.AAC.2
MLGAMRELGKGAMLDPVPILSFKIALTSFATRTTRAIKVIVVVAQGGYVPPCANIFVQAPANAWNEPPV